MPYIPASLSPALGITFTFLPPHFEQVPVPRQQTHIVPELQLLKRLMMAAETKAMHSESRLATGAASLDNRVQSQLPD